MVDRGGSMVSTKASTKPASLLSDGDGDDDDSDQ